MKYKDFLNIIPAQYTGKEIFTEKSIVLKNETEARNFYAIARERLLNINNWQALAGFISGKFKLVNEEGIELERNVQEGDYFKIDVPGPGNTDGEGYDWVYVEALKEIEREDVQSVGFRVRPAENPLNNNNETAHFYSNTATSTFIVTRKNNTVLAEIIDLNLKPNNEGGSVTDKLRNN